MSVIGPHYVELHFDGMAIMDDAGNPTYLGSKSLKPGLLAPKDIEQTGAFEGVYNFVIGYDGNGCVGLAFDVASSSAMVTIGH